MVVFVPTPIGNLEDISFRVLKTLQEADVILCEDTRISKKLLSLLKEKFNISTNFKQIISLHSHNEEKVINSLDKSIFEQNVVYMSDAGMPCISDPGAKLIEFCIKENIKYDVLAGANALLLAYVMSGFLEKEFLFFGFLSNTGTKRSEELNYLLTLSFNSVLYEAPNRVLKLIDEIIEIDENRELFLVKELTKLHQKSFRAKAKELKNILKDENLKGEWCVVIKGKELNIEKITKDDILSLDIPKKVKAKLIAKITGEDVKTCYNNLIKD